MTLALILALAWTGGVVGGNLLPAKQLDRRAGLSAAPMVACEGLAPTWTDDEQAKVIDWWASNGCEVTSYERGACNDDCDGQPCRHGAISIVHRHADEFAVERTWRGPGWAVVGVPEDVWVHDSLRRTESDVPIYDIRALLLTHGVGHACGVGHSKRARQVMSDGAGLIGRGNRGL